MTAKYGVEFTFRPFIKVVGVSVNDFRRQRIDILKHSAVVFTSRHAIDHFFNLCKELRVKIPETMKYFATSESVALYIQKFVQYRKRKVFFGTTGKVEDLVPVMAKHKSETYLVPQNDTTEKTFSKKLSEKGLKHTTCVMYRTVSVPVSKEEIAAHGMVVLFTSAGVKTLVESFPGFEQGTLRVATLGNAARVSAEEQGLRIDVVAPLPKQPSITGAIAQYLEEEQERDRLAAENPETHDSTEQEEKLRRSVAAKKGIEKKRRKQILKTQLEKYSEEIEQARLYAEECRSRSDERKRAAEQAKRQMEEAQKTHTEARHLADRAVREAEKARRIMREIQAKANELQAELEELEGKVPTQKGKAASTKKATTAAKKATSSAKSKTGTTKAKPKTAATTKKKASAKSKTTAKK